MELKEEIWEVANGLQNHFSYMGICHLIRPSGTPSHCTKATVPIMLCGNELVPTIVVQVLIQPAVLFTRQTFHGRGDVGAIFHKLSHGGPCLRWCRLAPSVTGTTCAHSPPHCPSSAKAGCSQGSLPASRWPPQEHLQVAISFATAPHL